MPGWLAGLAAGLAWEAWALLSRRRGRYPQTLSEAVWKLRDRAPWLTAGLWAALTIHFFAEGPRGPSGTTPRGPARTTPRAARAMRREKPSRRDGGRAHVGVVPLRRRGVVR